MRLQRIFLMHNPNITTDGKNKANEQTELHPHTKKKNNLAKKYKNKGINTNGTDGKKHKDHHVKEGI